MCVCVCVCVLPREVPKRSLAFWGRYQQSVGAIVYQAPVSVPPIRCLGHRGCEGWVGGGIAVIAVISSFSLHCLAWN